MSGKLAASPPGKSSSGKLTRPSGKRANTGGKTVSSRAALGEGAGSGPAGKGRAGRAMVRSRAAAHGHVTDEVLTLSAPWRLHFGDVLGDARIAYRLSGPEGAPVVAALGGISAHRVVGDTDPGAAALSRARAKSGTASKLRVTATSRGRGPAASDGEGWWPAMVGPGRGVDSTRYRILGIDYLGGAGDSSAPGAGRAFPPVSAFDQAAALRQIVLHLGLTKLHAIVGASYGGMVALGFAARYPELIDRIVVLSAADRAQPLSTAWRSVQRQIVREALARGDGPAGLRLARALAMTSYRSSAEFAQRFGGAPVRNAERFRFPVEDYLFARGEHYASKYRAESFLALSESIDLHGVDAAKIKTPATLIAVREDQLVPLADMQALTARLGGPRRLVEVSSIFGHDAFLKEGAVLQPIVQRALAESAI